MTEKIKISKDGLVFVIMEKEAIDLKSENPAESAAAMIKSFLNGDGTYAAKCMILPYPSSYITSLKRLRTGDVQRTGFLNMNFGSGIVRRVPSISLGWDIMDVETLTQIQEYIFEDEFWLYYCDTENNKMKAKLFCCADDGIKTGEIWAEYDENDSLLSGYKNVQIEFTATLNDDEDILRADNIAYGVNGLIETGGN